MNERLSNSEKDLQAKANDLLRQIEDEQMNCAALFTLNTQVIELISQLEILQNECMHLHIDRKGQCVVCSKYVQ